MAGRRRVRDQAILEPPGGEVVQSLAGDAL
jgi:hypothetical protein